MTLVFVVQMVFGIYLVHLKHGWFVVGHGSNGMEYSVTLIAVLLATALTASRETRDVAPAAGTGPVRTTA